MSSYCTYCKDPETNPLHTAYHDREYGFPLSSCDEFFERLVLEINQAGLSWETILKKRAGMKEAYGGFRIETVASYGEEDRTRLLNGPRVIRNRLKVEAAIHNARKIQEIQISHGSFKSWLDAHHPRTKSEWVRLFGKTFKFTGGEIVNEFLMSTGYLPGAHEETCQVLEAIKQLSPPWLQAEKA